MFYSNHTARARALVHLRLALSSPAVGYLLPLGFMDSDDEWLCELCQPAAARETAMLASSGMGESLTTFVASEPSVDSVDSRSWAAE